MITEHDIMELYRCLLGRMPEDADTIQAFRDYYPNLERGRKAVFDSKEFHNYYERVTGRKLSDIEDTAARLGFELLARFGANVPAPPLPVQADAATRTGLNVIYRRLGKSLLAVAIGPAEVAGLADLVSLGKAESAVLHIAPGFPPTVPLVTRLQDGTALFRLGSDAPSLVAFLQANARSIDVLALLGPPAALDWVTALRPFFSPRTLLIVGQAHQGFDAAGLSAAIAQAHVSEPVQIFRKLHLHHFGDWLLPVMYKPPATPPSLPDLAAYPRLAIAAIVRNERGAIENMLQSAFPVASFVAVLDTGSSDDTPALAKACLEASGVAFAFAQTSRETLGDDFSAMRNAALDMVPDTIDWVLMLDADEELVPEDYEAFLKLIAGAETDAFWVPRYNYVGPDKRGEVESYPDWQVRLIRRNAKTPVRYEGRVHETVRNTPAMKLPADAAAMGGARGGPHIHHLVRRFRSNEEEARKQEYYARIEGT